MKTITCLLLGIFSAGSLLSSESPLDRYRALLDDSPFLSMAFKARIAQVDTSAYQNLAFLGFADIDGEWQLCLYNKQRSTTHWVKVGEKVLGFRVASFNENNHTITLEKASVSVTVSLESP